MNLTEILQEVAGMSGQQCIVVAEEMERVARVIREIAAERGERDDQPPPAGTEVVLEE